MPIWERPPWLVRIRRGSDNAVVGAGVLVNGGYILTCAHVVGSAQEEVLADFPFVERHGALLARVVPDGWFPDTGERVGDIAVLSVEQALPPGARPAPLAGSDGVSGHRFRTTGFPDGHEGVVISCGVIVGPAETEWLQLQAESTLGFALEHGFSGAPVWDETTQAVVGIVATRERSRGSKGDPRTGYAITIDVVKRYWQPLEASVVEQLGQVIGELDETDALGLEVHQSVTAGEADVPVLPPYLLREHDERLREKLAFVDQRSRLLMLVGGSSTGKTRACWEAVRSLLPHWRVWHPLTPERPQALIEAVSSGRIGPRTVIWLNEAQMYLQPAGIGERVATALQDLLNQSAVAPVLVLGSMWLEYFAALTDPTTRTHAAARVLLHGRDIAVPHSFSASDLARVSDQVAADPRLRLAAKHGQGRITQHLAGVPELTRRYERANEHAKAVLWAAMDARRLSRWRDLPREFLYVAAPGYLDPQVWELTDDGDGWFDHALAYLTEPCHGASGPFARRKPMPGETESAQVGYRLADYLEEAGSRERARQCPPPTFWMAAARACPDPDILHELAVAAQSRGRLARAHQLFRRSAAGGDVAALRSLVELCDRVGDHVRAEQLARGAADNGETSVLRTLIRMRERTGQRDVADKLAQYAAECGDTHGLRTLARFREHAQDMAGAERMWREAADRGDTYALHMLVRLRKRAGEDADANHVWQDAANRGNTDALRELAQLAQESEDHVGAERYWRKAADRGDIDAVRELAGLKERTGDQQAAELLADDAAARGNTLALHDLARLRQRTGDHAGAERLWRRAADHNDVQALVMLARLHENNGEQQRAEQLAYDAAERGDAEGLMILAKSRERAGNREVAERLGHDAAARGHIRALSELIHIRAHAGDSNGVEELVRHAAELSDVRYLPQLVTVLELEGYRLRAEQLAGVAAERGDTDVLKDLALRRENAWDSENAERLWRQLADHGDTHALRALAELRERAGDHDNAEQLWRQLADHGDTHALLALAQLRQSAGDHDGADDLVRAAVDCGAPGALQAMIEQRRLAGEHTDADNLSKYGLTDDGTASTQGQWSTF